MDAHDTQHDETRDRFSWLAFVSGLVLGVIIALLLLVGGTNWAKYNGVDISAQAAATLLAQEVAEEGDTLVVAEHTDDEGNTVFGIWVGSAPEQAIIITSTDDGPHLNEVSSTSVPQGGSPSANGPWDSFWWRGDMPSENDPTPGVTKMYYAPIQGVGGGGAIDAEQETTDDEEGDDEEDDDGDVDDGPPGGVPGFEF